jgi:hypothetical protein
MESGAAAENGPDGVAASSRGRDGGVAGPSTTVTTREGAGEEVEKTARDAGRAWTPMPAGFIAMRPWPSPTAESSAAHTRDPAGAIVSSAGVNGPPSTLDAAPPIVVRITVTDNGAGIAPQELRRCMACVFHQIAGGGELADAGLGVCVVTSLARLMGGTVGAASTLGVGSSFWVELPLRPCLQGGSRRMHEGKLIE